MTAQLLQRHLESHCGTKLVIKINDNRSTMVSVRWYPHFTRVSLHRMFLKAPHDVMEALISYLRRKDKSLSPTIKAFIQENFKRLDYTHLIDQSKLTSKGSVYDLKVIYDALNAEYFDGKLQLFITWYGNKEATRRRSRVTFGLYHDPLKLIKINRFLDHPDFPEFLVAFVVYHEMLHHVCPAYVDQTGLHRIHSREFKKREAQFKDYQQAKKWIKDHPEYLFESHLRGNRRGRS